MFTDDVGSIILGAKNKDVVNKEEYLDGSALKRDGLKKGFQDDVEAKAKEEGAQRVTLLHACVHEHDEFTVES